MCHETRLGPREVRYKSGLNAKADEVGVFDVAEVEHRLPTLFLATSPAQNDIVAVLGVSNNDFRPPDNEPFDEGALRFIVQLVGDGAGVLAATPRLHP